MVAIMKKHTIVVTSIIVGFIVLAVWGYLLFIHLYPFKKSDIAITNVEVKSTKISFEYYEWPPTDFVTPRVQRYEYTIEGNILYLQFYSDFYRKKSTMTSNKIVIETPVEIQEIRIYTSGKEYKTAWKAERKDNIE